SPVRVVRPRSLRGRAGINPAPTGYEPRSLRGWAGMIEQRGRFGVGCSTGNLAGMRTWTAAFVVTFSLGACKSTDPSTRNPPAPRPVDTRGVPLDLRPDEVIRNPD